MTLNSNFMDESQQHLSNDVLLNYTTMKDTFSATDKEFIEAHLKTCSECNAKFNLQQEINVENENVSDSPPLTNSAVEMHKGIFKYFNYWKYAVGAFFVIATFIIFFYEPDAGKNKNNLSGNLIPDTFDINIEMNLDSLTQLRNQAIATANEREIISSPGVPEQFFRNVLFEKFIHQNALTSPKIILISPQPEEIVSNVITFKWQLITSLGNLQFSIVDNRNTLVYDASVAGTSLTIDKRLKDGLYYWKLESNEKLEAIGKFLIRR